MSILAIDYGRKKLGLALSRANFLASRYSTLAKNQAVFVNLQKIRKLEKFDLIVFGLPKGLDGRKGTLEAEARKFSQILEQKLKIPIIFVDESFSSEEAMRNLKMEGLNLEKSRKLVDQEAAKIILEEYLNSINFPHK